MSRRRASLTALLLAGLLTCAGVAAWLAISDPGLVAWIDAPLDEAALAALADADDALADEVEGDRDSDGYLLDARGKRVRAPDGSLLPPGARRTRQGHVLLADGTLLRTPEPEPVVRNRRGRERHETDASDGVSTDGEPLGREAVSRFPVPLPPPVPPPSAAPPGEVGGTVVNLRPAAIPGETDGATAAGSDTTDWEPVAERVETDLSRRPDLDVPLQPDRSRRGRERGADDTDDPEETLRFARHGLRGDYYDFLDGDLRGIPELVGLPPSFSRIDPNLDFATDDAFALPFEPETFAVRWTGFLNVPEAGTYEFACGSDDGARLTIGTTAVLGYGGLRAYGETSGKIELAAGRLPIEVVFFENYIFASCRLYWSGPSWRRRVVETAAFTPPTDVADRVQPVVGGISPSSALVEEVVTLRGVGFSAVPQLNRVTFDHAVAQVLTASETELTVRVPVGAASGNVVVQVGPLSSVPRHFEVENLLGLYGEYFLIGENLSTFPDFDALSPYFVRLDGPFAYTQDHLWDLPYEPDVFAARYTGFLYIPAEDDYELTLGSDDGAVLSIGGKPHIDLPGLHAYLEASRRSHFAAGFHPIEIRFFENRGVARLTLFWQRRGEAQRSIVPRGFLFAPTELSSRPEPQLAGVEPAAGRPGDTLSLTGSGFGTDARYVRVQFPGDVWVRPSAITDDRITVQVPYASTTGELRVDVGVRRSGPVAFQLAETIGLRADIYSFADAAGVEAIVDGFPQSFADRAPTRFRIDTEFRLDDAEAWNLGLPTEYFAVHWHGTIETEHEWSVGWALQSDDGAVLMVDGHIVVDNRPWHALRESAGRTTLSRGRHRIDIYYAQRGGAPRMHWFWTPVGRAQHLDVPPSWLRPDATRAGEPR